MHWSQFAGDLVCQYCFKKNQSKTWPVNGDMVPFYFQTDKGEFNLAVTCPLCGKEWYVVWDQNPGPIQTLTI